MNGRKIVQAIAMATNKRFNIDSASYIRRGCYIASSFRYMNLTPKNVQSRVERDTSVEGIKKKYHKIGETLFGSEQKPTIQSQVQYVRSLKDKKTEPEIEIENAVLFSKMKRFFDWIVEFQEQGFKDLDVNGYQNNILGPYKDEFDHTRNHEEPMKTRVAERLAYEAGRRKEYYTLKLKGKLQKAKR